MVLEYNGKQLDNLRSVYPTATIEVFEQQEEIFLSCNIDGSDLFYLSEYYKEYDGSLLKLITDLSNKLDRIIIGIVSNTGRTTRLVDKYIQELFTGKAVKIVDHDGTSDKIIQILINRLTTEHEGITILSIDNTLALWKL